jgi:hypothetical protein
MPEIKLNEDLTPEEQEFVRGVADFLASARNRTGEIRVKRNPTAEEYEYLDAVNDFAAPRIREI